MGDNAVTDETQVGPSTAVTDVDALVVHTNEAPVGTTISTPAPPPEPVRIPTTRYTDPEFAALENQKLWPHVWQLACSEDHLLEPGDFFTYECGDLSVLILRSDDGTLVAYQNVCTHRGNQLSSGCGTDMHEIRCVWHRWSWDLSGKLREVPSRKGFGPLGDEHNLIAVDVDTWGGLVFINLDASSGPGSGSLAEWIGPVADDCSWADLHKFRCSYALSIPMPCNWKVAIEAFSETYHVQGIHREMLPMVDDVNSPQQIWDRHGKLYQPYGIPSPRIRGGCTDQEVWDAFVDVMGTRAGVAKGEAPGPHPERVGEESLRSAIARRMAEASAAQGISLADYTEAQIMDLNQYNLFPNITVLVMADLYQVVRSRPGPTPDTCHLDAFTFDRMPDGAPTLRSRPLDVALEADTADLGLVLNQDLETLQHVQRGLHQPGLASITLSREECRIAKLHENLEEFLELGD